MGINGKRLRKYGKGVSGGFKTAYGVSKKGLKTGYEYSKMGVKTVGKDVKTGYHVIKSDISPVRKISPVKRVKPLKNKKHKKLKKFGRKLKKMSARAGRMDDALEKAFLGY